MNRKRLTKSAIVLCVVVLCGIVVLPSQPVGNVSNIKSVTISKLTETEANQLPRFSDLSPETCGEKSSEGTPCTIKADQVIRWGWGLCEPNEMFMHFKAAIAQVELIVDNVRLPDELIYQYDVTIKDRPNPYCHGWMIKLTQWQSGNTIRLENRAKLIFPKFNNVFLISVQ